MQVKGGESLHDDGTSSSTSSTADRRIMRKKHPRETRMAKCRGEYLMQRHNRVPPLFEILRAKEDPLPPPRVGEAFKAKSAK